MYFAHPTPWCQSNWSEVAIGNVTLCTFEATDTTVACFDSSSNSTVQKIRQCDQDETLFRVLVLAVVVLLNMASLLATLRLNRIINYVELYKTSKTFLGFPTQPMLHRAAVFQLIESETKEDTELFEEIFQDGKDLSNFINRPNSLGRTPLYNACERQSPRKVSQLLRAGADVNQRTANGQSPLHIACEKQSSRNVVALLKAGANVIPDDNGEKPAWESHYLALENSDRPEDLALVKTSIKSRAEAGRFEDQELYSTLEKEDLQLLGIRHTVVEPDLLEFLRTWNSAEDNTTREAEQRVIETFVEGTKVLTIPLSCDMGREKKEEMKEIVRKWNSHHTTKCEYLHRVSNGYLHAILQDN